MTNYQSLEDDTTAVELTSPSSDAEAQDAASDRALLGSPGERPTTSAPSGTITREAQATGYLQYDVRKGEAQGRRVTVKLLLQLLSQ